MRMPVLLFCVWGWAIGSPAAEPARPTAVYHGWGQPAPFQDAAPASAPRLAPKPAASIQHTSHCVFEPPAPAAPACGCCKGGSHGKECDQWWRWLCYVPNKTKFKPCCKKHGAYCIPPMYLFFTCCRPPTGAPMPPPVGCAPTAPATGCSSCRK
jgi:hypothetical protein